MLSRVFHNIKHSFLRFSDGKYALLIILSINFSIRLLIYFNTTQFSKIQGSILSGLETLRSGHVLAISSGSGLLTLSYVAYFFEYYLGSLHWFFVFQCLLSAISSWLVYLIIYKLSNNKLSAIAGLIIVTFYLDFIIISSILYNQVLEIFFTAVSILIIYKLLKVKSLVNYVFLAILLLMIIYISSLFRGTLRFLHFVFAIAAVIFFFRKNFSNLNALKFLITFILFYFALNNFSLFQFFPKSNNKASNAFIFYGHTLYGGNGGEGTFIYEKNRLKYKNELALYLKEKKIQDPTISDTNNFQSREMARFIKNEPLKWISLQAKKVLYTYGIVPIRDNITILMTGHIKFGLLITLFLSQATFILPLIMLLLFFNKKRFRELLSNEFGLVMILITVYLIAATSLYGHYQERYRIVVMVIAFIPLSVLFFDLNYLKEIFRNKRILIYKVISFLLLFTVWGYQAYEALVLYGARYMNAVDAIHNIKN